jgi:hypothetical protein
VTRFVAFGLGAMLLVGSALVRDTGPERRALTGEELTYFPSGKLLRVASLGFDGLAADAAFLQAVQYYGEHRRSDRQYPLTNHLFDVTTELDPGFVTPYLFGALVLADDVRRLDQAVALLERGMIHHPENWELPFEAGFLTFVHARDHARAAEYFRRSMALPDAPMYVRKFAAYTYSKAGSREASLALWREIEREAEEPGLREAARRYIEELEKGGTP